MARSSIESMAHNHAGCIRLNSRRVRLLHDRTNANESRHSLVGIKFLLARLHQLTFSQQVVSIRGYCLRVGRWFYHPHSCSNCPAYVTARHCHNWYLHAICTLACWSCRDKHTTLWSIRCQQSLQHICNKPAVRRSKFGNVGMVGAKEYM